MKVNQQKLFVKPQISFNQVKTQIDNLAQDPTMKLGLKIGLISIGLSLMALAIFWRQLPPSVPLFYSRPYGEGQLVSVWWLWSLPIIGLAIEMITIRFSGEVIEEDKFLAQLLIAVAALVAIMSFVTLIKILWLII